MDGHVNVACTIQKRTQILNPQEVRDDSSLKHDTPYQYLHYIYIKSIYVCKLFIT